jgi:hypothetical protein
MKETMVTRLARMEERLEFLHQKSEERHVEVKALLEPLAHTVAKHKTLHALSRNDKHWMYGISVFFGGLAGALVKYLPRP